MRDEAVRNAVMGMAFEIGPWTSSPVFWGERCAVTYGSAISQNLGKTPEGYLIARNCTLARTTTQTPQMYKRSELGVDGPPDEQLPVWRLPEV